MTLIAVFALVAGIGIVGFWTFALGTDKVPEVTEGDRAIWFHLVAEYVLGVTLIAGGLLLLLVGDEPWTRVIAAIGLGGMVYSTINSPGYYARKDAWSFVAVFACLSLLGVASLVFLAI